MRNLLPAITTLLGVALLVAGVAMIFVPAALIIAGLGLGAVGVFVVDDGRESPR